MKALISSVEKVYYDNSELGLRLVQVSEESFEVHSSLFWIDCEDHIIADMYFYDTESGLIELYPDSESVLEL